VQFEILVMTDDTPPLSDVTKTPKKTKKCGPLQPSPGNLDEVSCKLLLQATSGTTRTCPAASPEGLANAMVCAIHQEGTLAQHIAAVAHLTLAPAVSNKQQLSLVKSIYSWQLTSIPANINVPPKAFNKHHDQPSSRLKQPPA
jgi:hypothetical protein